MIQILYCLQVEIGSVTVGQISRQNVQIYPLQYQL